MIRINKSITKISICLLLVFLLFGCNRSPVGFDELGRDLSEPVSNQFNPSASVCYQKYIPNGASTNLILGKNPEYESRVLIMFPLADSALDSLTEVRLILKTNRLKSMPFNIHIVQQEWQENGITWTRTDSAGYWLTPGANFGETSIGNGTIAKDSTIIILSHIDSLVRNGHGIILIPQDTGYALLYSCETTNDPKIIYKYAGKERIFTGSADASIIDTVNLQLGRNNLWIGAGYGYQTCLQFNVDTFPAQATITDGELTLHPAKSFLLTDTVGIGVHRLLEPYQEGITPKFSSSVSAKATFMRADTVIKIDLKSLVQFWSLNPDSNFGLILNGQPEYSDIFRVELKTNLPDLPLLKTGYILPPEGRF